MRVKRICGGRGSGRAGRGGGVGGQGQGGGGGAAGWAGQPRPEAEGAHCAVTAAGAAAAAAPSLPCPAMHAAAFTACIAPAAAGPSYCCILQPSAAAAAALTATRFSTRGMAALRGCTRMVCGQGGRRGAALSTQGGLAGETAASHGVHAWQISGGRTCACRVCWVETLLLKDRLQVPRATKALCRAAMVFCFRW